MRLPHNPAGLWLAFLLLSSCAPQSSPDLPRPEVPPPSLLLISIDTLRADHLRPYGYPCPTSPNLLRLRKDAVLFANAIAQAPSTLPSHASLFSSLLPSHHGASFPDRTPIPAEVLTLAEVLRDTGYRTRATAGAGQMDPVFGVAQGFEEWVHPWYEELYRIAHDESPWTLAAPGVPFFLFVHTYQVHHPYTPPDYHREIFEPRYDGDLPSDISVALLREINDGERPLSPADLQHIVSAYDAEIRAADDGIGFFLGFLQSAGLYDDMMIVVTSDHGEELNDHGIVGWHSHTLYDELLRIPLLVKFPGNRWAGATVEDQVRAIDVAPTILAGLGLEAPEAFDGVDLSSLLEGTALDLPAVSEIDYGRGSPQSSIRRGGWKLVGAKLYRLDTDPQEKQDVAAQYPDVAADLGRELATRLSARKDPHPAAVSLDRELEQQLEDLGYLN